MSCFLVKGSKEFEDFLHCLGDTVDLHGWTGYRGGLDVKDNTTGVQSLYTMFEGHEVMFHVSVMLPFSKDSQQVSRLAIKHFNCLCFELRPIYLVNLHTNS